jgi:Bacterial regulatory protein, Fis family
MTGSMPTGELRAYAPQELERPEKHDVEAQEPPRLETLHIPVGTNLADVERWMIFATLQKCGGNKTRAAALLGVSLKTLYNRLNAYRSQGLAMDYAFGGSAERERANGKRSGADDRAVEITDLRGDFAEVPL